MFLRHLLHLPAILLLSLVAVPAQAVQTCPAGNDLVTPNTDLVDNADSTVTHTKTGLLWKQCSEGFSGALCGTRAASVLSWVQAQGAAFDRGHEVDADCVGRYANRLSAEDAQRFRRILALG